MPQGKSFGLVKPMYAFVIVAPSFAAKHDEYSLAAVVNPAGCDLADTHSQRAAISRLRHVGQ